MTFFLEKLLLLGYFDFESGWARHKKVGGPGHIFYLMPYVKISFSFFLAFLILQEKKVKTFVRVAENF